LSQRFISPKREEVLFEAEKYTYQIFRIKKKENKNWKVLKNTSDIACVVTES